MEPISISTGGFVPDFAKKLADRWNRGPHVLRDAVNSPLFTGREFMTAMIGAATDYAANPTARVPPGRLFLSGKSVEPAKLAPLLPRGGGETCEQYVSRIR
jgi:hypothetical protein